MNAPSSNGRPLAPSGDRPCPSAASAGPELPTTLLLGRGWKAAERSVRLLARRLAGRLGHAVEVCDLDGGAEPLVRGVRAAVERGTARVVLLPVVLDGERVGGARLDEAIAAARGAWPFLRVHRGVPPATDDVARMLGDRAREAVHTLAPERGRPAEVVVVIASGDGANPARNAEVARLARLVYEAHRFGEVTCAFGGLTTPSVAEVVRRWARLGARAIVIVPHLLYDPTTRRRLGAGAREAAAAAGVEVAVARSLDGHPALVWALARRHLEALQDTTLLPPEGRDVMPYVNPALLRDLQDSHGHDPEPGGRLDQGIDALLPPRYRDPGLVVSSASMGAAPLLRDADGRVAWDQIWQGFCELALAGGPPHRGTLLEAVAPDEALADPARYAEVQAELARGIQMVTGLPALVDGPPGWIGVACADEEMAIWLMRAIVVENVMVRREGRVLYLPASSRFTLEGEIKNVVTALAKTHHYWTEHVAARANPYGTARSRRISL
jgi:sirohydrochlorin cobaltochelatase